jgi:predicted nucleic-acid-binding Zn-ribbon protein
MLIVNGNSSKGDNKVNEQPKRDTRVFTCPKCGGRMFGATTSNGFRLGSFFIYALERNFWRNRYSTAQALVCEQCGYTELYAMNVAAIKPKQG